MADPSNSGYNPPGYPNQSQPGYGGQPEYGGQSGAPHPQQPGAPPQGNYPPYNYQPMAYYYYISSKLSGLVLDVEGGGMNPPVRVVLWHKKESADADNQLWYNDYSTGTIKSKLNNLCIEFKDGQLVLNNYQPGNSNQLWEGVSQAIKNRMNPNLAFEVQGGNKEPGASLTVSNYTGSIQQQFEPVFPPPPPGNYGPPGQLPPGQPLPGQGPPGQPPAGGPDGSYPTPPIQPLAPSPEPPKKPAFAKKLFYLVCEMHGKVMDIEGTNEKEGAAVIAYQKQPGAKNQLWYVDEEGLLRSALNDFVPCGTGKSTPIKMVRFTGGASQRFRLDGKKVVNGVGEAADVRGQWKHDGAPIITYKYGGASNQHWKAEYV